MFARVCSCVTRYTSLATELAVVVPLLVQRSRGGNERPDTKNCVRVVFCASWFCMLHAQSLLHVNALCCV